MIMMVMGLLSVGFTSCSKGDNDQPLTPNTIKEELKPFIGYWQISNDSYNTSSLPDYHIFFYLDGICHITYMTNLSSDWYSWNYDTTTKYLSIAGLSKAQWQITSITDNAWSGLALWYSGNNNGYSANKLTMDTKELFKYILRCRDQWICDTISAKYKKIDRYYYSDEKIEISKLHTWISSELGTSSIEPYSIRLYGNSFNCYEDKEKDIITVSKDQAEGDNRIYFELELFHPYNYKDCYMNIKIKDKLNGDWTGKFLPKVD